MATPGQRPTTSAFTVIAGARAASENVLAREVFGVDSFNDLTTDVRSKLRLLADDAAFEITNLSKWYMLWDPSWGGPVTDGLPPEFNELFRLMWTERAFRVFRSAEEGTSYAKEVVAPGFRRVADAVGTISSFGNLSEFDDATSIDLIMRSAFSVTVRQRDPVVPPFEEGYRTIRAEFVKLWEERRWSFRIRHVSLSIAADGSVSFTEGDINQFDGFASKNIWLSDNRGSFSVAWLDSERFVQARAALTASSNPKARPRWFYVEDHGDTTVINWAPEPDKVYAGVANIIIKAPPFAADPNSTASTNGLNSLPPPFRHHLRDRVLARLLSKWGREDTDAARWLKTVKDDRDELADNWVERGAEASNARPKTFADRLGELASSRGNRGLIGDLG